MLDRRTTLRAAAALATTLAAPAIAQARQRLTIVYGGDAMQLMPLNLAQGAGLFAAEGLEVDWIKVSSGPRQAAAVMGGSADMTPLALFHVMRSQAEGAELVAFCNICGMYAMNLVLSDRAIERSGIKPGMAIDDKVSRLAELKIGISAPGASTDALIRSVLLARGRDPDRFLTLQALGGAAAIFAGFQKNLVDGFVYTAPLPEMAQIRGLGRSVIDPFSGEVPELVDVPIGVMVTTRKILADRAPVMEAGTRALARALTMAKTDPAQTKAVLRPFYPDLEQSVYELAVDKYRGGIASSPLIPPVQVSKTVAWNNIGAAQPGSASYEAIVAVEPARRVAEALGLHA